MANFWDSITAPLTGAPLEEAARLNQQGAQARADAIAQGEASLRESYGAGRGALTNYYTQALQPYMAMQPQATGGYNAYADASGANGLAGQIRAQQNFTTDPGYRFAVDQSTDQLNRAANARGVAVGNSTSDVAARTSGLAAQSYGDYVNRLAPWLNQNTAIASGISNIDTGLGSALNANYTGEGTGVLGAQTNIGAANQQGYQALAQGALAPMTAGSNIWNLGLNLGSAALGMPGVGSGISRGISNLFSSGTNYASTFAPPGTNFGAAPNPNPLWG